MGVVAALGCAANSSGGETGSATTSASSSTTEDDPSAPASSESSASTTVTTTPDESSSESSAPAESSESSDDTVAESSTTSAPMVPEGCYDYYAFEPFEVSFRNDVMPIFVESCWECHADPVDSGIFLGYGGNTENESTMVHANLLSVTPLQAPTMTMVVPGDPLTSWFMAKMEYEDPSSDCPLIECPNPGCDRFAPPDAQLPDAQRAIIRSWILNGAPDN